jgi:hypothetical protein
MNKWRSAGLAILALTAGWLVLRSCTPAPTPVSQAPSAPPREVFHASKPLRVAIVPPLHAQRPAGESTPDTDRHADSGEWLERELRFVLLRGKMRVAARSMDSKAFVLRVALPQPPATIGKLELLAPDGVVERQTNASTSGSTPLAIVQSLARQLPAFLGATTTGADWGEFIGTSDADAYQQFLLAGSAVLDSNAVGFTQPPHSRNLASNVEQLEALTRRHPQFARAQSLLAIAYLGLGGDDQESLTNIADNTAKKALVLDDSLADAHAAMGLARLRRGEWIAARERFDAALDIDGNDIPALEGLACLLTEVGQPAAALPIAQRAIAMQPGNLGANECLAYARIATSQAQPLDNSMSESALPVARVVALSALLSGDVARAEQVLATAMAPDAEWVKPLLRAAVDKKATPEALRAVTRAAGDGKIDAATEVMCGAALRQPDFVFNRMSRLEQQSEAIPLRLLWLPQTDFLRKHRRFEQLITTVDLGSYWQEHGRPDICEQEPKIYGCSLRPPSIKTANQPSKIVTH